MERIIAIALAGAVAVLLLVMQLASEISAEKTRCLNIASLMRVAGLQVEAANITNRECVISLKDSTILVIDRGIYAKPSAGQHSFKEVPLW